MRNQSRVVLILGAALFLFGLLLGLLFSTGSVWGDLEAIMFDPAPTGGGDAPLSTLRCPVLITAREGGLVSATFHNPSQLALSRTVRFYVSHGFATLVRQEEQQFLLQPGETRRVSFAVTAEDAAWRHFILVRINVLRNLPLPSHSASCGVIVLNLRGLTGGQVVALAVAVSLLSMAAGMVLWIAGRRAADTPTPDLAPIMAALAALTVLAMFFGARGSWVAGGLLIIATLLVGVTLVTWSVTRSGL